MTNQEKRELDRLRQENKHLLAENNRLQNENDKLSHKLWEINCMLADKNHGS